MTNDQKLNILLAFLITITAWIAAPQFFSSFNIDYKEKYLTENHLDIRIDKITFLDKMSFKAEGGNTNIRLFIEHNQAYSLYADCKEKYNEYDCYLSAIKYSRTLINGVERPDIFNAYMVGKNDERAKWLAGEEQRIAAEKERVKDFKEEFGREPISIEIKKGYGGQFDVTYGFFKQFEEDKLSRM
ncbi:hypothetical protein [Pseudomonas sp. HY7a-MNA-CIBAN-0227]|uniref:hypothetical protein n=1 Tax=Pseudomonas sp. HY7a-MNA-CIBAN-0227 TaxID=3140474 RepID=UPI003317DEE1